MSYATTRHFIAASASTSPGGMKTALPWETGVESSAARHDSWLLSFIDILALLLTLFVLLLAYQDRELDQAVSASHAGRSENPEATLPAVAQPATLVPGLQSPILFPAIMSDGFALPGEGLLPLQAALESGDTEQVSIDAPAAEAGIEAVIPVSPAGDEVLEADEKTKQGEEILAENLPVEIKSEPVETETGSMVTAVENQGPVSEFLEAVTASGLNEQIEVNVRTGGVNLEIRDNILFTPASAALTEEGIALLHELAALLLEQPFTLSVEGHTDSVPIETTRYPSNWELSSARAAIVTRSLIDQGIVPDRLRAIGYGDTRPLADNGTPEGRSRNRRVSFVLQIPAKNVAD